MNLMLRVRIRRQFLVRGCTKINSSLVLFASVLLFPLLRPPDFTLRSQNPQLRWALPGAGAAEERQVALQVRPTPATSANLTW